MRGPKRLLASKKWDRIKYEQIKNLQFFAMRSINRERCELLVLGGDRVFQMRGRKDPWLEVMLGV
jgi:hypothetical protein